MLIMYLLGMLFHPANVSSLVFALELKSCSALCELVDIYNTISTAVYLTGNTKSHFLKKNQIDGSDVSPLEIDCSAIYNGDKNHRHARQTKNN